jgi:HPr kinase/phosphorylase
VNMTTLTLHATAVAIAGEAVLIRGEPGSGKSTLALQLVEMPGTGLGEKLLQAGLIADDQTVLTAGQGRLWCSAPLALAGLLEVRGLGIVKVPVSGPAPLRMVVDLEAANAAPRLPESNNQATSLLGLPVPRIILNKDGEALASRLRTAFLRL